MGLINQLCSSVALTKWLNSMVYGIDITIDNELVFMVCINQQTSLGGAIL